MAKCVLHTTILWANFFKSAKNYQLNAVADPGFPVGGHAPIRGHGPLMWMLFGENVCKNERIGSHRGFPPRSTNEMQIIYKKKNQ